MKTIVLLAGLLAFTGVTIVNAQDNNQDNGAKDIPEMVKTAFAKLYPNVKDVKWRMEDGNYEGRFSSGGSSMSVHLSKRGQLIEKEKYIQLSDLPQQAQDYLNQHYSGATFHEISEVTKADNKTHYYEVETHDKELFFDMDGKLLKEKIDED